MIGHEKYFLKFFSSKIKTHIFPDLLLSGLILFPSTSHSPRFTSAPGILVPSFLISFNLIQNSCLVLPRFTLSKLLTPSNTHLITDSQFHSFSPRRTLYETHFTLPKLSLSQTPTSPPTRFNHSRTHSSPFF